MPDLATLCYQENRDTHSEINRYFGFFRRETAALAKVAIGKNVSNYVYAAGGTLEGIVKPQAWPLIYHTDLLHAHVRDTQIQITIGARKRWKATMDLPCAGIISELAIEFFSYDARLMEDPLVTKIKNYLSRFSLESI